MYFAPKSRQLNLAGLELPKEVIGAGLFSKRSKATHFQLLQLKYFFSKKAGWWCLSIWSSFWQICLLTLRRQTCFAKILLFWQNVRRTNLRGGQKSVKIVTNAMGWVKKVRQVGCPIKIAAAPVYLIFLKKLECRLSSWKLNRASNFKIEDFSSWVTVEITGPTF